jgi:hemerythrin-like domain-containing protein
VGAIEWLMQEHEVVARGLGVLRGMADAMERGETVLMTSASRLLDFFEQYADEHHHQKEELLLFPALIDAGMPGRHGPIPAMLNEHDLGRALVERMRTAAEALDGPATAREAFVAAARDFCELLTFHIQKENNVLFDLAERLLSPAQQRTLSVAFERLERAAQGSGRLERNVRALEELGPVYVPAAGEAA